MTTPFWGSHPGSLNNLLFIRIVTAMVTVIMGLEKFKIHNSSMKPGPILPTRYILCTWIIHILVMLYLMYFSSMHFLWQFPSPSTLHPLLEIKINLACLCPSLGEKQTFPHTSLLSWPSSSPLHTQTEKKKPNQPRHTAFHMNWHFRISSSTEENCFQG